MGLSLRYLGHSCFEVSHSDTSYLIDPFITGNPLAEAIDISLLSPSHVFVSHGHQDHMADAEAICRRSGAPLVSNYEIVSWFQQKNVPGYPLNPGGFLDLPTGRVKYVPAIHSSVLPDGSNGGNPGGFVFLLEGAHFYFAGDTCAFSDMQLIPKLCGAMDFCILPLGGTFTMEAQEAVLAAQFVGCNRVIGCHYDTFGPIEIDHDNAIKAFAEADIELTLPKIGEELTL